MPRRCGTRWGRSTNPELGIWLKEAAHGQGWGTEAIKAVAEWATKNLAKESFLHTVAVENLASRRIAEKLNGEIVGTPAADRRGAGGPESASRNEGCRAGDQRRARPCSLSALPGPCRTSGKPGPSLSARH